MNKPRKESSPSALTERGEEILKNALDSHRAVTLRALDVIPSGQRILVYILWTLSALAGLCGLILATQNPTYGFVIILTGFFTITLAVVFQNRATKTSPEQLGMLAAGQVSGPTWARAVPKMPISPPEKLDQFQLSLRELRTLAVTRLNEERKKRRKVEIPSEIVRLNVFMVNTDRVAEFGEVCGLFIPKKMQDNMSGFPDRDVRFRPHEGLTGRTFTLGEPCGTQATPDEQNKLIWERFSLFPDRPTSDEWDEFILSTEQIAAINPDLRWIISFPLRYEGNGPDRTFAVLNIDGLHTVLSVDELRSLAVRVEPNVKNFAAVLATLPKVRIAIRVEDVA